MHRLIYLAALLTTASIFSIQAAANDVIPDVGDETVDNIVVTGHLTPATVPQISSSFSVVERLQFEQRQSIFATNLLQDLPSLAVSRSGTFGSKTAIRVRGAEANQVMVMIDGMQVNDLARDDAFDFSNLTSYDIERIEVLRGPQSALYGSDALAGVINVITRRADEPFNAEAFFEGGSFDTVNLGGRIGAARETSNISFGASWLDTEGTNISRQGSERDGYENLTATLNSELAPTDNLNFEFVGRYSDAMNEFDDADFGLPVDADRRTESKHAYLQGRGGFAMLNDRWTHELRLTWVDTDNRDFDTGAWNRTQAGEKTGLYYQTSVGLDGRPVQSTGHELTLAIDHHEENFKQRGLDPFGDPNKDESLDNTGYVAEYRAQPLSDWVLSLAARYDDNSDFKNAATYRATTSYRFSQTDTRIRGTIGTGQKNPTFTERFGYYTSTTSSFVGNPNLRPEESRGWDIGIDQGFLDSRLIFSATYFNEQLEDEINGFVEIDPVNFIYAAVNEDGTSDRKGAELWLTADLGAGIHLKSSYTYTDAKDPDGSGIDRVEIRRPRHMAALNVNYAFARDRANLNINASYTGDQQDDDFSTFPATRVDLDAYTLVDLTASYAVTKTVKITARAENLFDKTYENVYGFATPGRAGYVGVQMKFAN